MYLVKLIHAASRYLAVPPIQSQLTLPANIDLGSYQWTKNGFDIAQIIGAFQLAVAAIVTNLFGYSNVSIISI